MTAPSPLRLQILDAGATISLGVVHVDLRLKTWTMNQAFVPRLGSAFVLPFGLPLVLLAKRPFDGRARIFVVIFGPLRFGVVGVGLIALLHLGQLEAA